ncbi:MAG TPA: hypothetical protein ENN67_05820 [Firmicutes bacterium]|nr:hypothetical protein [Bacillota bacterium]
MKNFESFFNAGENPLYGYLIDIQEMRVAMVELLAPRRHAGAHLWTFLIIMLLGLGAVAPIFTPFGGFFSLLLLILGPILLFGGIFLAGWNAQMQSAKNYISPLDSPQAIELLLCSPLSEREIVSGTLLAYLRYPFIGLTFIRMLPLFINALLFAGLIYSSVTLTRNLSPDMLILAMKYYLPAACVFIFAPLLTGIETLMVPSSWLSKRDAGGDELKGRSRTGWLTSLLVALSIIFVVIEIYTRNIQTSNIPWWIITRACPVILIGTGIITAVLIAFLPHHLSKIRRG